MSNVVGVWSAPRTTASANTVITVTVPPRKNAYTHITKFAYTEGATDHTLTALLPLNYTTLSADTAANSAVINLVANPGHYNTAYKYAETRYDSSQANNAIAANDYVVVETADGTYHTSTVSSVSSLAVTLNDSLSATGDGAKKGAKVWFYGIITDVNPKTKVAHPNFDATVNTQVVFPNASSSAPVLASFWHEQPIILRSTNGTNAGSFDYVVAEYVKY